MTHLTPDELIDVLDEALTPGRLAHLDACAHCQREVADLRGMLGEARQPEVPEPSPLFWDHLSARVRSAVDEDTATRPSRRWFEWPVLAPLGVLAILVIALVSAVPMGTRDAVEPPLADGTRIATNDVANPEDVVARQDMESQWAMLDDLVGALDVDADGEAGIWLRPGSADNVVLQLSSTEQQELLRLLHEELKSGS
jgi:hypothetical protein